MDQGDVRTHTFTWREPPADGARLSGRAYLEALRDGELPPPPMVALLGFRLVEVGEGRVLFTAEPQEYFYNGIGLVHGGYAAAMFDTAVGCAAVTCVRPEQVAVTMDLHVRFFKPLTAASGTVRCEGSILNVGRTTATAEGRLTDQRGRLHGHATSTLALVTAATP